MNARDIIKSGCIFIKEVNFPIIKPTKIIRNIIFIFFVFIFIILCLKIIIKFNRVIG